MRCSIKLHLPPLQPSSVTSKAAASAASAPGVPHRCQNRAATVSEQHFSPAGSRAQEQEDEWKTIPSSSGKSMSQETSQNQLQEMLPVLLLLLQTVI